MANLVEIREVEPFEVWGEQVRARKIEGEDITLAVVELAPGAVVPEHRHPQEQLGICITGSVSFRIDDEVREFGPGGTWRILSDHPHEVHAGPQGAVVIDVFSPTRSDWTFPMHPLRPPVWPPSPDGPID